MCPEIQVDEIFSINITDQNRPSSCQPRSRDVAVEPFLDETHNVKSYTAAKRMEESKTAAVVNKTVFWQQLSAVFPDLKTLFLDRRTALRK